MSRASTSPKPYELFRFGAMLVPHVFCATLQGTANFSSAASMAAGSVIPCCISIAAMPDTCGVAWDVPAYPTSTIVSKRGARYCCGGRRNVSVSVKSYVCW